MIRKLPLVLAIAATLAPIGACALGLGEIHLKSALNQGFNADIELLAVKPGELDDVKTTLASPESFVRAGVERPFLLSKLRFDPELKPDGAAVVRVTSREPIREPFLNFLIEVNWPKGRLVREYTVLLDPPLTLKRAPAPVRAPKLAASPKPAASAAGVKPAYSAPVDEIGAQDGGESEYGPTKKNDTLWHIAKRLKSDQASVEQMIMALWRENPHAFYQNNVNNLKVGQILRVPADEAVRALVRSAARREFLDQTAEWRERRRAKAERVVRPTEAAPETAPQAVADTPPKAPGETPSTVADSALKLTSAAAEGKTPTPGSQVQGEAVAGLQNELLLAREENQSARQESGELKTRIVQLESQLLDVQRLLKLTNSQLAQMQAAVSAKAPGAAAVPGVAVVAPEIEVDAEPVEVVPELSDETGLGIDEERDQLVEEAVIEEGGDEVEVVGEEVLGVDQAETPQEPGDEVLIADASESVSATQAAVPAVASEGLFDRLRGNATYLGIGGVAAVLLLGLFGLALRRRRAEEAQFKESLLTGEESQAGTETKELFDGASPESQQTDDISFLSDFSPSSIDAIQEDTGEVDPLSEADVYIAYGRYQQAEDLIKQAIERYPERQDLKHKLLEVAFATKDAQTFTATVEDLHRAGARQQDAEGWQKVVTMGRVLAPGHELFAGPTAGMPTEADVPASPAGDNRESPVADMNAGMAAGDKGKSTSEQRADAVELGEGLDFDLGLNVNGDSADTAQAALKALENTGSTKELDLELDLDALSELESALQEDQGGEGSDLEQELTLDDLESAIARQEVEEDIPQPGTKDFDQKIVLEELDLEGIDLTEGVPVELDEAFSSLGTESALTEETTDLGQTKDLVGGDADYSNDEVATKLDLARAYVDMGDAEGARSILDEVLLEGSKSQKEEANELLAQLK